MNRALYTKLLGTEVKQDLLEEKVVARREVRGPRRVLGCPPVAAKVLPDQTRNHPALELAVKVLQDLQMIVDWYYTRVNAIVIKYYGTCIRSRVAAGPVLVCQGILLF